MRYVAISRPNPWSPIEIVGVGENMEQAYAGARAWFENAFEKYGDQRWNELVAMQNHLDAVPETVLEENTGVSLDEWLARLASAGQGPGTPQTPTPPMRLTVRKARSGWEQSIWIVAAILVAFPSCYSLVDRLRADPNVDLASLMPEFVFSLGYSAVWTAIWFFIFRWFKNDATLQDYLFFLIILQLAGFVMGASMGVMSRSALPFS